MIVKEAETKFNFGEKGYLAFEHVTWVRITSLWSTLAVCSFTLLIYFSLLLWMVIMSTVEVLHVNFFQPRIEILPLFIGRFHIKQSSWIFLFSRRPKKTGLICITKNVGRNWHLSSLAIVWIGWWKLLSRFLGKSSYICQLSFFTCLIDGTI